MRQASVRAASIALLVLAGALAAGAAPGAVGAAPLERDPAEQWVGAKAAYESGDYVQAAELYRRLLDGGHDSGLLHYNLGNTYLRNGELGRAVASYLRSRSRLPRDGDLAANLEFARRSAKDAIAPPEPSALVATLFFWHYSLSVAELAWLATLLNLLFWSALAARLHRRAAGAATAAAWVLGGLLAVVGLSLGLRLAGPLRIAVVVPQEVPAYTAPDPESVVRFKLHAGSELRLRAERDGWLRVALPDGEQGWIESGWAEIVAR